jgi:hypothetical protein
LAAADGSWQQTAVGSNSSMDLVGCSNDTPRRFNDDIVIASSSTMAL